MTCITLAILDKEDDRLRKRLEDNKVISDFFLEQEFLSGAAKAGLLVAVTERKIPFEGVNPLQMEFNDRQGEDFLALICESATDYSRPAYKAYADPFNTRSLFEDARISDGFIIRAGAVFDSPKDNHRLLAAMKDGARISSVYRRSGEPSAIMDGRTFLARFGPYHPALEEIMRPFAEAKGSRKKTDKKTPQVFHTVSLNVHSGKITVDNMFKPKTLKTTA